METKPIIITILVALVALAGMVTLSHLENSPEYSLTELESLADCLADSGAKFYGAYWCTHCQAQKRDFGEAAGRLPFVECAVPGSDDQAQECKDAGITSYPTWEFADGGITMGRIPLSQLAERAQCEFPGVTLSDVAEADIPVEGAEKVAEVVDVATTSQDAGSSTTEL